MVSHSTFPSPLYSISGHFVFIHLHDVRTFCLPDGYEVFDSSLDDVKKCLSPTFSPSDIIHLNQNSSLARDVYGVNYLPGFVGLNNLKHTDYVNVTLHALSHVTPVRNYFLNPENYGSSKSVLVNKFGEVIRKLWSRYNFKSIVSPQDFLQVRDRFIYSLRLIEVIVIVNLSVSVYPSLSLFISVSFSFPYLISLYLFLTPSLFLCFSISHTFSHLLTYLLTSSHTFSYLLTPSHISFHTFSYLFTPSHISFHTFSHLLSYLFIPFHIFSVSLFLTPSHISSHIFSHLLAPFHVFSHLSPQHCQEISVASKKRFNIGVQAEAADLLAWLLSKKKTFYGEVFHYIVINSCIRLPLQGITLSYLTCAFLFVLDLNLNFRNGVLFVFPFLVILKLLIFPQNNSVAMRNKCSHLPVQTLYHRYINILKCK